MNWRRVLKVVNDHFPWRGLIVGALFLLATGSVRRLYEDGHAGYAVFVGVFAALVILALYVFTECIAPIRRGVRQATQTIVSRSAELRAAQETAAAEYHKARVATERLERMRAEERESI